MQKRALITTIIIPTLVIFGTIIVLLNNQRERASELILTHQHVDFGAVPEWEGPVTKTVTAQNVGDTSLQIERIQPGCTYADINGPSVLPPGTEGTFKIVINPENLTSTPIAATATFFTNSPRTPHVSLTIAAASIPFASLSAEICDFGSILPNTVEEKKVKLYVNAPLNLDTIRLLPSNQPSLTWKMARDSVQHTTPQILLLTVHLGPLKNREPFSAQLTVAFPNERTLTLPIIARVVAPITVKPQTVSFGAVPAETTPALEITLSSKTPFKVLEVEAPDVVKVIYPAETSATAQTRKHMKIVWKLSNSPQLLREEIRVHTTVESLPLRIPVYGFRVYQHSEP